MKSRFAPVLVVAATFLAGAAGAASRDAGETIKVDRTAIVAGSILPAGTYQVELAADMDSVRLVQAERAVVEAPCTVALTPLVYPGNAVTYREGEGGREQLVKIVLAASKLAIELPAEATGAPDASIANAADRR
jgi:hypothetical protein